MKLNFLPADNQSKLPRRRFVQGLALGGVMLGVQ